MLLVAQRSVQSKPTGLPGETVLVTAGAETYVSALVHRQQRSTGLQLRLQLTAVLRTVGADTLCRPACHPLWYSSSRWPATYRLELLLLASADC